MNILSTYSLVIFAATAAISDWRSLTIPNWLVAAGAVVAVVLGAIQGVDNLTELSISAGIAFAVMIVIYFFGHFLFRREAMGIGDIKLAAVLAMFLGWQMFLAALWMAIVGGASYGILWHARDRSLRRPASGGLPAYRTGRLATTRGSQFSEIELSYCERSEAIYQGHLLPFGSFLCLTSLVMLLWGQTIMPWLTSLLVPQ